MRPATTISSIHGTGMAHGPNGPWDHPSTSTSTSTSHIPYILNSTLSSSTHSLSLSLVWLFPLLPPPCSLLPAPSNPPHHRPSTTARYRPPSPTIAHHCPPTTYYQTLEPSNHVSVVCCVGKPFLFLTNSSPSPAKAVLQRAPASSADLWFYGFLPLIIDVQPATNLSPSRRSLVRIYPLGIYLSIYLHSRLHNTNSTVSTTPTPPPPPSMRPPVATTPI
ncbi:hypothetical protein F4859DRAFT_341997 [Xylaria cf. heliscus]|nr:hypothetical protein F4859DRAFT_341997 [Xylaria cf. heliscus]